MLDTALYPILSGEGHDPGSRTFGRNDENGTRETLSVPIL